MSLARLRFMVQYLTPHRDNLKYEKEQDVEIWGPTQRVICGSIVFRFYCYSCNWNASSHYYHIFVVLDFFREQVIIRFVYVAIARLLVGLLTLCFHDEAFHDRSAESSVFFGEDMGYFMTVGAQAMSVTCGGFLFRVFDAELGVKSSLSTTAVACAWRGSIQESSSCGTGSAPMPEDRRSKFLKSSLRSF